MPSADPSVYIPLSFKDQRLADRVRQYVYSLGAKIDGNVKPDFKSRKLSQTVKENKPPIVNTQCVVYLFQCDLCDANYDGFTARHLRLQYTFGSAIFFQFGFLGQSSGRRIISNFWKKILKKATYKRRNGGFTFSPEVKVYLLIDRSMVRMQSTETYSRELPVWMSRIDYSVDQHCYSDYPAFLVLGVTLLSHK